MNAVLAIVTGTIGAHVIERLRREQVQVLVQALEGHEAAADSLGFTQDARVVRELLGRFRPLLVQG